MAPFSVVGMVAGEAGGGMSSPNQHGLRTLSAWIIPEVFAFVGCQCGWQQRLNGAWATTGAMKSDLRMLFEAHLAENGVDMTPADAGNFE